MEAKVSTCQNCREAIYTVIVLYNELNYALLRQKKRKFFMIIHCLVSLDNKSCLTIFIFFSLEIKLVSACFRVCFISEKSNQ